MNRETSQVTFFFSELLSLMFDILSQEIDAKLIVRGPRIYVLTNVSTFQLN